MFITQLRQGRSIMIGEAKVNILKVKGCVVHIGIEADKSIIIKNERKDNAPQLKQDA